MSTTLSIILTVIVVICAIAISILYVSGMIAIYKLEQMLKGENDNEKH